MKILLDGYLDKNFGDDLMLTLAANALCEHELYMKKSEYLPLNLPDSDDKADIRLTVTGSGFLLYGYKSVIYRTLDILHDCGKHKRAVIGCNISEFPSRLAEWVVLKQLSRLDFITVRDKYSYDYIRKKLPRLKCECYPDMVFSIPDGMIAKAENEGALGISTYKGMDKRFAEIADDFIDRTGNRVLLFALDVGGENDLAAADYIKNTMRNRDRVEVIGYDGILKNIRRCGKLIGVRFHSIVIALRAGVPVIPIAYSDKTRHMLDDIGFDENVFDWRKLDFNALHDRILLPSKPFELDKSIIIGAGNHIKRFKEEFLNDWERA